MNVGNLREVKENRDLEEAKSLLKTAKEGGLNVINENAELEGRNVQGVCLGTVIDLFENYYAESPLAENSSDQLKKLADYKNGASSKAAANQIVYESVKPEYKKSQLNLIAKEGFGKEYDQLDTHDKVKTQRHLKEQAIFDLRGLKIEYTLGLELKSEDFNEKFESLPAGTYFIGLPSHAIGYVKHQDGTGHLFDPNKGLIRCNVSPEGDHSKQLQKLAGCYQSLFKRDMPFAIEIKQVSPK